MRDVDLRRGLLGVASRLQQVDGDEDNRGNKEARTHMNLHVAVAIGVDSSRLLISRIPANVRRLYTQSETMDGHLPQ
jgi:hypothetical protein